MNKFVLQIKSIRFYIFIISVMFLFCGCDSLPRVQLGECEALSGDKFAANFKFDIPDVLRYRYRWYSKSKEQICNGIIQKSGDDNIYIAGFSDSGITLYVARLQKGQYKILKNNLKISEKFLISNILSDLLLVYSHLPSDGYCIRQNPLDDSLWLKMDSDREERSHYFILIDNQPAWAGLKDDRVYFKALALTGDSNIPAITIENYKEGYSAQVRYSKGNSEE